MEITSVRAVAYAHLFSMMTICACVQRAGMRGSGAVRRTYTLAQWGDAALIQLGVQHRPPSV